MGKQYGSFTVSIIRACSQKATDTPAMIPCLLSGQTQTGGVTFPGAASCPMPKETLPICAGNMHCQQISVTGLIGVPLQRAPAWEAEAVNQKVAVRTHRPAML